MNPLMQRFRSDAQMLRKFCDWTIRRLDEAHGLCLELRGITLPTTSWTHGDSFCALCADSGVHQNGSSPLRTSDFVLRTSYFSYFVLTVPEPVLPLAPGGSSLPSA